ncbi:nucleotidyltransferase family protein [Desulfomonile tiedjei]|uniref:Nucleoside-diphosphate-sugar pyrophosphorylase family protein n=1 Tax=Desulfomonile tiedjei (strain ATCC 49306 / DSM 6799 / DCB-1) TaxID=706587 RepID=I4CCJ9_DESTA|nr:nucleotidyltransferase family protein [Desulfomonile tiedjei]AFM27290.1 Nucleoside-diphosphate-sugar pyrophosphorylase family protein [Desulfomonile tiedjei DSM 6799]
MQPKPSDLPISAFILAGGLGLRLREVVSDRPKPMADIGQTPFLHLLIELLSGKGIREFVLLTGFMGEVVEEYFHAQRFPGVSIRFSKEPNPLGTGGAVKFAERFAAETTLLVNGDTFFDADVEALYRFHRKNNADVTLSLYEVEDVSRYGSVQVDSAGKVTGFTEKNRVGGIGLVNAGCSLLSADFIRQLPEGAYSMEERIFPELVRIGTLYGLVQSKPFFDIGTPESYEEFRSFYGSCNLKSR